MGRARTRSASETGDIEVLEVVDGEGRVVGIARREACHQNPSLLHRVVHVLVVNGREQILLQKRSPQKDIQPGKWDTSVGGHLHPGEEYEEAAAREMTEELGISGGPLTRVYDYRWGTARESELVRTYLCLHDGPFCPEVDEISEVAFWSPSLIQERLGDGTFTPNFEEEFARYLLWKG